MKGLDARNPKIIVKNVSGMVRIEKFVFQALTNKVPQNTKMKINLPSYPSNETYRREKFKYCTFNYLRYGQCREILFKASLERFELMIIASEKSEPYSAYFYTSKS